MDEKKRNKRERNNHALYPLDCGNYRVFFLICVLQISGVSHEMADHHNRSSILLHHVFSVKPQNKMKTVKKVDKNIKMSDVLMSRFFSIINRLSSVQS